MHAGVNLVRSRHQRCDDAMALADDSVLAPLGYSCTRLQLLPSLTVVTFTYAEYKVYMSSSYAFV